jgi:hypothetical protein
MRPTRQRKWAAILPYSCYIITCGHSLHSPVCIGVVFISVVPEARSCCVLVIVFCVSNYRGCRYTEDRTSTGSKQLATLGRTMSIFFIDTDTQEAIRTPLAHDNVAIESGVHCSPWDMVTWDKTRLKSAIMEHINTRVN